MELQELGKRAKAAEVFQLEYGPERKRKGFA